jgi:hypothetical protein
VTDTPLTFSGLYDKFFFLGAPYIHVRTVASRPGAVPKQRRNGREFYSTGSDNTSGPRLNRQTCRQQITTAIGQRGEPKRRIGQARLAKESSSKLWNEVPLEVGAVDVVVYLHGFSQQGREMRLAEKRAALVRSRR